MIAPGGTLGILGGGQLARMTALAARRMGYRVHVFEHPAADAPAAPVCEETFRAPFDDADALRRFAAGVDVVTLEFENIPIDALHAVAKHVPVRPGPETLEVCQHREREKRFLERHGFPCAPFRVVASPGELRDAAAVLGLPGAARARRGRVGGVANLGRRRAGRAWGPGGLGGFRGGVVRDLRALPGW